MCGRRNRGYIFTAPKRLIAGETENVCLSLHNLEPPAHVNVDLLALSSLPSGVTPASERSDALLASATTTLKSGALTELHKLVLCLLYLKIEVCAWIFDVRLDNRSLNSNSRYVCKEDIFTRWVKKSLFALVSKCSSFVRFVFGVLAYKKLQRLE